MIYVTNKNNFRFIQMKGSYENLYWWNKHDLLGIHTIKKWMGSSWDPSDEMKKNQLGIFLNKNEIGSITI